MKRYREGSAIAESYNSGLVVFLYDETSSDVIGKASPKILEYFDDESHEDPALKGLAAEGLLVVYELSQDDELCVEVAVGPPLSDEELSGFPLGPPPVSTFLRLPSGRLCIEGYDSLRVGPEAEYIEEEGSVVEVPPGDYTLTLYREDAYYDDGEPRPMQVITLSPPEDAPPVDRRPSMILFRNE